MRSDGVLTIVLTAVLGVVLLISPGAASEGEEALVPRLRAAVERGLPLVQQAAGRYPEHRKCFSCHHQTLPMLAMVAAKHSGLAIDQPLFEAQKNLTLTSFRGELDDLRAGKNIGGKALTVSYGLWTLSLAGHERDEVTEAMVTYLLKTQEADGHWGVHVSRPPMEDSFQTTTVLSIIGLQKYATDEQRGDVEAAVSQAGAWIDASQVTSQEDRVSRLWMLHMLGRGAAIVDEAKAAVLAAQRDDGGWAQLDSLESDAYATGLTLCVLFMTGSTRDDAACRRGLEFLLTAQQQDGSWFVKSRSKPVQVYFDNGDPHGKDQFISTPASCWALVALSMGARDKP
jgi:N-acyl-D-amino-acid deacylase